MRRKILLLATWYPSKESPVNGIFIREQARLLAEQNEVTVVAPQVIGMRAFLRRHPWSTVEADGDLRVYREYIPVPPYVSATSMIGSMLAAWRGTRRVMRERGKPDVIHAHVVLPAGWVAARISHQFDIPAMVTEHTSPFSVHLRTSLQRRLVRETLATIRVAAVSPALRQTILAFAPEAHVYVLPEVVAARFFTHDTKSDVEVHQKKRILVVALLSSQKGIPYLLDALALLREHGSGSFEVVIGGDGPDRRNLEQHARERGLTDVCRFVGLLNQEQVRSWMRWCDVFVLPSLHETFGIVVGEAMACGKPVIATRCGGPEYVVDESSGVIVPPADSRALANALERFLKNQVRYDPETIRTRVVERFGEDAFLRGVTAIYDDICLQAKYSITC